MAVRGIRMVAGSAAMLAGLLALTACSDDDSPKGPGVSGSPAPSTGVSAGGPSGQASAYPVAPSAVASPLPVIGSGSNGSWSFDLNSVTAAGPGQLLVVGTLRSKDSPIVSGFQETGFEYTKQLDGRIVLSSDFSAVTVTAPGDSTVYQPVRDSSRACACTRGGLIKKGEPYPIYVLVTAPPSATTVTVMVSGFAPFKNVPVGS